MKIEIILVPTDFSADAAKALESALALAKVFKAKVELLHVYHVDMPISAPMGGGFVIPEDLMESVRTHAAGQVAKLVANSSGAGVEISGHTKEGPASETIVSVARELSANLIVMGTRGRTGLKHVFLGSVAERTVRTATCPVLTMKADA